MSMTVFTRETGLSQSLLHSVMGFKSFTVLRYWVMVLWVLEQWQPLALHTGDSSTLSSAQNIFVYSFRCYSFDLKTYRPCVANPAGAEDVLTVLSLTKYAGLHPMLVLKRPCVQISNMLDPLRVTVLCRFYCCEYICATIHEYICKYTNV